MNYFTNLVTSKSRFLLVLAGVLVFSVVGFAIANSFKSVKADSYIVQEEDGFHIKQELSEEAIFDVQEEFSLNTLNEQNAPINILEAKVKSTSPSQYKMLTNKDTELREVITVPKIVFQNTSEKTITDFMLAIDDKSDSNGGRGLYFKDQSIKPGQKFTILPVNFIRANGKNPATNPKFWLGAKDKSNIVVSVSPTFEDGTKWFPKEGDK